MKIRKHRQAAGVLVRAVDTGAVLMILNRWRRVWENPGGSMRPVDNGAPKRTAWRELREETGMNIPVRWVLSVDNSSPRLTYTTYAGLVAVEMDGIQLSAEHTAFAWIKPEELLSGDAYNVAGYCARRLPYMLQADHWPGCEWGVGSHWT
jgi:8-oxo-dGTP pyrophosphatase MutT (NUDIX family)